MAVSELQINARSMTFDALCAGAEGDPLLILLHGLPRNRWEWHHQIAPMAELGFRVVAPDLRGFCAGARPQGVEAYHVDEYAQDVLAIADAVGSAGKPFHLMGTSIGASMAWWLAGRYAERVATLVCINIPHPGALAEQRGAAVPGADDQAAKFSYISEAAKEGNERHMFESMLAAQGVSAEESEPYRTALDDDDALVAVFNYYRALRLWNREPLAPASMPTLFIWPTGSQNVAGSSIEANANWVTGPYRLEVITDVHQPALQAAPDVMTSLLVEHLRTHVASAAEKPALSKSERKKARRKQRSASERTGAEAMVDLADAAVEEAMALVGRVAVEGELVLETAMPSLDAATYCRKRINEALGFDEWLDEVEVWVWDAHTHQRSVLSDGGKVSGVEIRLDRRPEPR